MLKYKLIDNFWFTIIYKDIFILFSIKNKINLKINFNLSKC